MFARKEHMKEISFIDTRPLARTSPLAISLVLHAALIFLLSLIPSNTLGVSPAHENRKHTVLVLNFRDLPYRTRKGAGSSEGAKSAAARPASAGLRAPAQTPRPEPAAQFASVADPGLANKQPRRAFELPPDARIHPVKQTLVQFDVPPDVLLKQEVPLPNVVFLTSEAPARFKKRFVAPPVKAPTVKAAQNITPAPDLPNREPAVSDLKLAAAWVKDSRRLVLPPATTSPVRMPHPESIDQVPQVALPDSNPANTTALIALTDSPTKPDGMVIVPPANQISNPGPSGSAGSASGAGRGDKGEGQGAQIASAERRGTGDGKATLAGVGAGSTGINATASGSGNAGIGTANGAGTRAEGQGTGLANGSGSSNVGSGTGAAGNDGTGLDQLPANVTRINLPKDGKFGVVVTGSSQATPYPETIGALSGKMVYTVYLSVGLHKKWILQYCLTKEAARLVPRGSGTPLEAPWPFLVFRPDQLAQPGDYVVVHGVIDAEGHFDQLAMVFPDEFDQKDLLISSLKHWSFRPASRDRQATSVEILLIIPAES